MSNKYVKGFTLLEVVMSFSFITLLILLALSAWMNIAKIIAAQEGIIRTDQQAQRVFATLTKELGSAILPAAVGGTSSMRLFEDVDGDMWGFGGTDNGTCGTFWRSMLQEGMDNIAYVTPVDVQGVGDYSDADGHYQLGQIRPTERGLTPLLGATGRYEQDPDDPSRWLFRFRDPNEYLNVTAIIDPAQFNRLSTEVQELPDAAEWRSINNNAWLDIAAFMAIRFIPLTEGGQPVIVSEADTSTWPGFDAATPFAVDLDGNGSTTDRFHLGKLQLLYSGGDMVAVDPVTRTVVRETREPIAVNLTGNVVLRKEDRSEPIFRLMGTTPPSHTVNEEADGADVSLLRVRMLLLDSQSIDSQRVMVGSEPHVVLRPQQFTKSRDVQGRWYETYISMSNMTR